jgi:hypothetical protein
MNHKEIIENMLLGYPIYEYAFLETEQLTFSDKVGGAPFSRNHIQFSENQSPYLKSL